jgi:hypothetical protein
MSEENDRNAFRSLLSTLCWHWDDASAFGRLQGDEEVPAREVLSAIPDLYIWAKRLTDDFDRREASPAVIDRFKAYAKRQAKLEAVATRADRLVADAVRAGLTYQTTQNMIVRALDRYAAANPEVDL